MKRFVFVLAGTFMATTAFAQFPEVKPTPGETLSLVVSLQKEYGAVKTNLLEESTMMPEGSYSFRPTPDIRTYGELMGHAANAQFGSCAVLKGVPNPNQGVDNEKKATKAESVKAMAASFAFCDSVFSSLTEKSALEMVTQGSGRITRLGAILHLIAHSNEVYGVGTVYMRLKGVVPPTTERGMVGKPPVK